MEFITLTRQDADFESHLLGTFSKTHRALPVETFQSGNTSERVTFQLVPLDKINKPPWYFVYLRSIRLELMPLTLGPAMAAWLNKSYLILQWTRWTSWSALLGIFFLHAAMFLYNDVQDHLKGADRRNRRRGSQVIQRGWVTAYEQRQWSLVNLGLAILFGLPALWNYPTQMALILTAASVCLVLINSRFGIRYFFSDLAIASLFGPLLVMGISLASFGRTDILDFALGFAFGSTTLWVFQMRQFQDLFRARPEDFRTFLAFLNFDLAKKVLIFEAFLLLAIHPVVAILLRIPVLFLLILPFAMLPLIFCIQRLIQSTSPLSSSLIKLAGKAIWAKSAIAAWWVVTLGILWVF